MKKETGMDPPNNTIDNPPGYHATPPAIRIRALCHDYGERRILNHIDLDIAAGRLTVLLGKNGSGKSTLFRLLAGFLPTAKGTIELLGHPSESLTGRQRAQLLGFLPQQHRPVFPFTVRDVVLTGRAGQVRFTPKAEDLEEAEASLTRIGIEHLGPDFSPSCPAASNSWSCSPVSLHKNRGSSSSTNRSAIWTSLTRQG